MVLVVALLAVKGEKNQPEHVKGSQQRCKQADGVKDMSTIAADCEGTEQNGVLGKESGEERRAGDGQRGDEHGPVSEFDFFAEAAHVAHILFAAHSMNDGAGSQEEQ